jgi:hypothetical protein
VGISDPARKRKGAAERSGLFVCRTIHLAVAVLRYPTYYVTAGTVIVRDGCTGIFGCCSRSFCGNRLGGPRVMARQNR